MYRFLQKKKIVQRLAGGLLILAFIAAPYSAQLEVQRAHALFDFGSGIELENMLQNTLSAVSNGLSAESTQSLAFKENVLDGIAHQLAQRAISEMTGSIVNWINSGFQGSPAFVTDLGGFMRDIADEVVGEFIYGSELSFLCSPFKLNVQAALLIQYQQSQTSGARTQCTFTGILDNLENFGKSATDWGDWFQIATVPQNNQYGALMLAQAEMRVSIESAQGEELTLLGFGDGFLSMQQCEDVEGGGETCQVVTPGAVIADQLNRSLGAGQDALIQADEINEIINALLGQLAQQAVTGVNGLLGLSSGSGTGGSYTDRLQNPDTNASGGFGYAQEGSVAAITNAIEKEEELLGFNQDIVALIDEAEADIPNDCTLTLPEELTEERADALSAASTGQEVLSALIGLRAEYQASSDADERSATYADFAQFEAYGNVANSFDVLQAEVLYESLRGDVDAFEEEIDDEC